MPLIEHGPGADRPKLPGALLEQWDWVVITSPEAATVFLEARQPPIAAAAWAARGAPCPSPAAAQLPTRTPAVGADARAGLGRGWPPAVARSVRWAGHVARAVRWEHHPFVHAVKGQR